MVMRDGEPVELEPAEPRRSVDFGEPIGVAETIYTLHSEVAHLRPTASAAARRSFRAVARRRRSETASAS